MRIYTCQIANKQVNSVVTDSTSMSTELPTSTNRTINATIGISDQTLHTPDVDNNRFQSKTKATRAKHSASSPAKAAPKTKTSPVSAQKSSDATDDLLAMQQSSQKSSGNNAAGNADNLSLLLKGNPDYNQYFSIESIMLYGLDNNASALPAPVIVPEIEAEGSITFTGTGLSPFLKIQRNEPGSRKKDEVMDQVMNEVITVEDETNEKPEEPAAVVEHNAVEAVKQMRYFVCFFFFFLIALIDRYGGLETFCSWIWMKLWERFSGAKI